MFILQNNLSDFLQLDCVAAATIKVSAGKCTSARCSPHAGFCSELLSFSAPTHPNIEGLTPGCMIHPAVALISWVTPLSLTFFIQQKIILHICLKPSRVTKECIGSDSLAITPRSHCLTFISSDKLGCCLQGHYVHLKQLNHTRY